MTQVNSHFFSYRNCMFSLITMLYSSLSLFFFLICFGLFWFWDKVSHSPDCLRFSRCRKWPTDDHPPNSTYQVLRALLHLYGMYTGMNTYVYGMYMYEELMIQNHFWSALQDLLYFFPVADHAHLNPQLLQHTPVGVVSVYCVKVILALFKCWFLCLHILFQSRHGIIMLMAGIFCFMFV